jgi:hypothetical protein
MMVYTRGDCLCIYLEIHFLGFLRTACTENTSMFDLATRSDRCATKIIRLTM